jgi:hypothetical protein
MASPRDNCNDDWELIGKCSCAHTQFLAEVPHPQRSMIRALLGTIRAFLGEISRELNLNAVPKFSRSPCMTLLTARVPVLIAFVFIGLLLFYP